MPPSRSARPSLATSPALARWSIAWLGLTALGACDRATDAGDPATVASAKAEVSAEPGAEPAPKTKPDAPDAPDEPTPRVEPVAVKAGPGGATPIVDPQPAVVTPAVLAPPPGSRTMDETNTISVFEAAAPATVFVTQTAVVQDYGLRTVEVPAGAGTGFIWDADGHIVTNCHVALADCGKQIRARKLSVTLYDQKSYPATLVGSDPFKDIAVLKIEPTETLVPIRQVGEGYDLVVGQKTVAIGNPFGLDHTLTTGVVSAMGREVVGIGGVTIRDMVQTDAAINPGNSGGPLLDSRGQLIGMNTMIFSKSGSSAGIGFAVPHTVIGRVVPQIIEKGRPTRVGLGINILDDSQARRLGVEGVVIERVQASSAASKAGLRSLTRTRSGWAVDVIVGIDGKRVKTYDDLYVELEDKSPRDTVKLSVLRLPGEEVLTIETELVEL